MSAHLFDAPRLEVADKEGTLELGSQEREALHEWLVSHLRPGDLKKLASDRVSAVSEVLEHLDRGVGHASKSDLADRIIEQYDVELLADEWRRRLLIRRWNSLHNRKLSSPLRWRRGGYTALRLVEQMGLPLVLAGNAHQGVAAAEDVDAYQQLGPLHPYQRQVYDGIKKVLRGKTWRKRRGLVWLPTGTGKTRVMVEALLRECALEHPRNVILWIADRAELCEQAVESFRHVWQTVGGDRWTTEHVGVPHLRIVRFWDHHPFEVPGEYPTVIVASIQKLAAKLGDEEYLSEEEEAFREELANLGQRAAAVVFDEAHKVESQMPIRVLRALGLTRNRNYLGRNRTSGPPFFGLTATPGRRAHDETERLRDRFEGRLIEPTSPAYRHLRGFVKAKFLSKQKFKWVKTDYVLTMQGREREQWEKFKVLPKNVLSRAGQDPERTATIIRQTLQLTKGCDSVLVFACSVEHAMAMTDVLRRMGQRANGVHGGMSKPIRQAAIRQFRKGAVRFLVNCDLLTAGFDAPKVDAVVLARPVDSHVLLAQMIGRGLRGPRNGGTASCLVVDCEDSFGPYKGLEQLRSQFRRDWET